MAERGPKGHWKKGKSANPKGRPPILAPEVQHEINRNRNALKQLILAYFNLNEDQIAIRQRDREIPYIEKILGQCFERTALDGDVDKFRKLLEIVFGKLPEDKEAFELSPEEKLMVMTFRKRINDERGLPDPSGNGSNGEDPQG